MKQIDFVVSEEDLELGFNGITPCPYFENSDKPFKEQLIVGSDACMNCQYNKGGGFYIKDATFVKCNCDETHENQRAYHTMQEIEQLNIDFHNSIESEIQYEDYFDDSYYNDESFANIKINLGISREENEEWQ